MKIMIVTPYFYPHVGGVEIYTLNIAKQLRDKGRDVVIVTAKVSNTEKSTDKIDGIKIYRLPVLLKISNTPVGLFWRNKLKKIIQTEKPDVINGHTPVPYMSDLAERVSGNIPFVLTYHNDIGKDTFLYRILVWFTEITLTKRTLKRSKKIIATSDYYVNRSKILSPFKNKIEIVSPGVDISQFNPKVSIPELKAKYKGRNVILFVGSLNKTQQHKGLDQLIRSFHSINDRYTNCKLVIIGEGDMKSNYIAQVKKLGLADNVDFMGYISNKRLAQFYKLADMLVMPSVDNNEGFGMVLLEANAAGTPVIGTKVGGIPFVIQHNKTGLLVSPNNTSALSSSIARLLTDQSLAKNLGHAGSQRAAKDFDWKVLSSKTDTIFNDSIKPTIVQVVGYYPPHLGGMEQVTQIISEQLAEEKYTVKVMTSNKTNGKKIKETILPNLEIRRFNTFEFAHTPIAFGFIPAIFKIPKASVIHLHLGQAFYPEFVLLVSKMRKIPYVVHFHLDLQPSGSLGSLFLLYKSVILKPVIKHANQIIVFSSEQKNFISVNYQIPVDRIQIIPNGVDKSYLLKPKTFRHKAPFQLVYVGRLTSQKRVHILIDMMSHIKTKAVLTLVGDGDKKASLEKQVSELKLKNIRFAGVLDKNQIIKNYKDSDVFTIASENEGMSLAVLEAMAAGLPIVGSNTLGLRDIISGVGLLINEPNGTNFAESMDKLLNDQKQLRACSENSYLTAKRYSWNNSIKKIEQIYRKV